MDFESLYDQWLDSAAQKLYEILLLSKTTDLMVEAIYADRKRLERKLADFDFLIKVPNRSEWVKSAFEYAVENHKECLDGPLDSLDDIFEMCRKVRAHRKTKRNKGGNK